jgi:hypothetical protein
VDETALNSKLEAMDISVSIAQTAHVFIQYLHVSVYEEIGGLRKEYCMCAFGVWT